MEWLGRPLFLNKCVVKKVAEKLAPKVLDWIGYEVHLDLIIDDLCKAMSRGSPDGYKIAERLEPAYEVDSELVEILNEAWGLFYDEFEKVEIEWVKDKEITLSLELGTKVSVNSLAEKYDGEIVGLDHLRAKYIISDDKNGQKFSVNFEYVTKKENKTD